MEILIVPLLVVAVILIIAAVRKAPSSESAKPKRIESFEIDTDPETALKAIARFAQQGDYQVDNLDEENGQITLSDSATVTSWGFFYPIYLSQQSDDTTLVEIGIQSKAYQAGPIVSRHHEKCVNGIKAALFAGGA